MSDLPPSRPGDPCVACGLLYSPGVVERRFVNGALLMLCMSAKMCCSRYRRGLSPKPYAELIRQGLRP